MAHMKKTLKPLVISIVAVLLLAGLAAWQAVGTRGHYAVYLTTGDVYFGRIVRFPSFGLKNVYLLQVNAENAEKPVSVQKFDKLFWGPKDFIKVNRDRVVWTVKLDPAGDLATLIKSNPELALPGGAQTNFQPQKQDFPQDVSPDTNLMNNE